MAKTEEKSSVIDKLPVKPDDMSMEDWLLIEHKIQTGELTEYPDGTTVSQVQEYYAVKQAEQEAEVREKAKEQEESEKELRELVEKSKQETYGTTVAEDKPPVPVVQVVPVNTPKPADPAKPITATNQGTPGSGQTGQGSDTSGQ